jgi:hypothetical protein
MARACLETGFERSFPGRKNRIFLRLLFYGRIKKQLSLSMPNQDLINYVDQCRSHGMNDNIIRQELFYK